MIPLFRNQLPASKAELSEALNDALKRFIKKDGAIVTVYARVFPYLDEIALDLDGATIQDSLPSLAKATGESKAFCEAAALAVAGKNVSVSGLPFNLQLSAREIVLHSGRDEKGDAVLIPKSVRSGQITLSATQLDLEKAVRELAQKEGARHGLTIEDARIALRARGARSISADIHLRARKLLFRTEIDISGQMAIDDSFVARISNLKCRGSGAIGSVACGVLQPHLEKLEGRSFSLLTLPFSDATLRDLRITVADTVELTADFGAAA